jgi:hypothetical protein
MEFTGVVTHIGEKETFGETFTKRSVRLEEVGDKQYPASICVDFANKMLEHADKLKTGDIITASLNFKTNESKKDDNRSAFPNDLNNIKIEVNFITQLISLNRSQLSFAKQIQTRT